MSTKYRYNMTEVPKNIILTIDNEELLRLPITPPIHRACKGFIDYCMTVSGSNDILIPVDDYKLPSSTARVYVSNLFQNTNGEILKFKCKQDVNAIAVRLNNIIVSEYYLKIHNKTIGHPLATMDTDKQRRYEERQTDLLKAIGLTQRSSSAWNVEHVPTNHTGLFEAPSGTDCVYGMHQLDDVINITGPPNMWEISMYDTVGIVGRYQIPMGLSILDLISAPALTGITGGDYLVSLTLIDTAMTGVFKAPIGLLVLNLNNNPGITGVTNCDTLLSLTLWGTGINGNFHIPDNIRKVSIGGPMVTSVTGGKYTVYLVLNSIKMIGRYIVPPNVRYLNMRSCRGLTKLDGGDKLMHLNITNTGITGEFIVPEHVKHLTITHTKITRLTHGSSLVTLNAALSGLSGEVILPPNVTYVNCDHCYGITRVRTLGNRSVRLSLNNQT